MQRGIGQIDTSAGDDALQEREIKVVQLFLRHANGSAMAEAHCAQFHGREPFEFRRLCDRVRQAVSLRQILCDRPSKGIDTVIAQR